MSKVSLFLRLYRNKKKENLVIFILFALLSGAVSMVLLVQHNHGILLQNQLIRMGLTADLERFCAVYQNAESILGVIAIAAMVIGAIGGLCLIGFRNKVTEKAMVMMHIYGMKKEDICIKAAIDAVIFGIASSILGYAGGYSLFWRFARRIFHVEYVMGLISVSALAVFLKTFLLCVAVVFLGNLYIDMRCAETAPAEYLFRRKGAGGGRMHIRIILYEMVIISIYILFVFRVNRAYLFVSGAVILFLAGGLFFLFYLFFGLFAKRKRSRMKVSAPRDLSFCFLCSRNKRDAVLSIVISVGTVVLCLAANILLNVRGILRSAYRDNMGYTCMVSSNAPNEKCRIERLLDENGLTYTAGYSKLMDYAQLNGMDGADGKFWALIIGKQTDANVHFSVPEGMFKSERYFGGRCGLVSGQYTEMFGASIRFGDEIKDNQYLSLVSYNLIVNEKDWQLGIDESFRMVWLIDASVSEEKMIKEKLVGYDCNIESASGLIDELRRGMADYIELLAVVAGMLFLVTAAIFYNVIRHDFIERKTESYLYRVYGASFKKVQGIVALEYLMIAFAASFAVSLTIMGCGELYFYYGLKKHFPLSVPIVAMTTVLSCLFVFSCCYLAGKTNEREAGAELIRDE